MKILTAYIMNNLRILEAINPGDNYYEAYLGHLEREGDEFFDQYHLAIEWAMSKAPKRILEIGVRTGISICQLLSSHSDRNAIERIVLCDIWNDGYSSPFVVKYYLTTLNLPLEPIEFIKGDSKIEIPKLEGEFDYILVDGSHDKKDAACDLENVVRLCAKGGIIVFDDISKWGCDLLDVWAAFKKKHSKQFEFHENMHGKGTAWAIRF